MTMKDVMKMAAGLRKRGVSKKEALKRAWATIYPKDKKKSKSRRKVRRKSNPKRKVRRTARRKKRRRRSMTIPLAPIAGLAAGMAVPVSFAMKGNFEEALRQVQYSYTGIDITGKFRWDLLQRGLVPLVVGALVHKYVGGPPLNVNRMLGRANVPLLRI